MNKRKKLLAMILTMVFCLNVSMIAFAQEEPIMPMADTFNRYQFTAWNSDYGTKTFWFRFQHGCKISQSGSNSVARDHSVLLYKLPEDYILPAVVGNGSASFTGIKAYTESGSVVNSTSVTGYYSVMLPVDSIIWYKAVSTSNEYLTVPYNMMKYYMQADVLLFGPDNFTTLNTNFWSTPRVYFSKYVHTG